jgi:hypothetical protein
LSINFKGIYTDHMMCGNTLLTARSLYTMTGNYLKHKRIIKKLPKGLFINRVCAPKHLDVVTNLVDFFGLAEQIDYTIALQKILYCFSLDGKYSERSIRYKFKQLTSKMQYPLY